MTEILAQTIVHSEAYARSESGSLAALPCFLVLLAPVVVVVVLWSVRSRDVNRRYGKLRTRLAKVRAEIDYLEERGIEKAGTLDTPLKDLRVERAAIEEELKLINEARKRAGTTRICPETSCGHENAPEAKHCARCGRELT